MTNNLNDTQLVVLTRAAEREDRLLERPLTHAGAAAAAFAKKLIRLGLAEPVTVSPDQPHWQRGEAGEPIGLAITPAGLAALNIAEGEEPGDESATPAPPDTDPADQLAADAAARPSGEEAAAREEEAATGDEDAATREPADDMPEAPADAHHRAPRRRDGTKRAGLLTMLRAAEGATLDMIVMATGWLPHTARAAITGLRKDGHAVERFKDEQGTTRYRIAEAGSAAGSAGPVAAPAAPEA